MENTAVKKPVWYHQTKQGVYWVLGFIEILLLIRLLFKLLGANPASGFAALVYALSGILTAPFNGIFSTVRSTTASISSVFEPGTIIAMLVYAVIAWGIISILKIKVLRS